MSGIAEEYGLTSTELAWYNPKVGKLKSGRLRAGQALRIPIADVAAAAFDVPDPAIERYGSSMRGSSRVHVVRRGESLGSIAQRYGTTVKSLVRLNGLKKLVIYPGQSIIVRSGRGASRRSASGTRRSGKSAGRGSVMKKTATPGTSAAARKKR
jgi:LysM repeat protein